MTIHERKAIPIPQVEPRKPIPEQNLRIPGPTPVPAEVLKELTNPLINHRAPAIFLPDKFAGVDLLSFRYGRSRGSGRQHLLTGRSCCGNHDWLFWEPP